MVSIGAVVSEIAGVSYNALLVSVSTPRAPWAGLGLGWGSATSAASSRSASSSH
jgi:UMF1 family MFS transporter